MAQMRGVAQLDRVTDRQARPAGRPRILGAKWDPAGTRIDFKVFSKNATRIQLEVFSKATGQSAQLCLPLTRDANGNWSGTVSKAQLEKAGVTEPVFYGYRAWGPNFTFDPSWQ